MNKRTFFDLVSTELRTNDTITLTEEELNEGILFQVSPFIALTALKQKVFGRKSSGDKKEGLVGKAVNAVRSKKAKAMMAKEKLKAEIGSKGKNDSDTHYKFTKEQKEFMAHILNKYGKKIVKEITEFRKNILAPYQIIKRQVKENRQLTDKEINGMTREEYLRYRESGRKKIEKRGTYDKDFDSKKEEHRIANEGYRAISDELRDFKSGKRKDISESRLEKLYELLGYGTDKFQGYTNDEFLKTKRKVKEYIDKLKTARVIGSDADRYTDKSGREIGTIKDLLRDIENLYGKGVTKTLVAEPRASSKEGDEIRKGSFKRGFIVYLLRQDIRNNIRSGGGYDAYKNMYIQVLEQAVKEAKAKKDEMLKGFLGSRDSIEFNKYEKKIWAPLPTTVRKYSGNINDYYLKIKEEDFGKGKNYKKPESIDKAEDAVNKETKRFERNLATIIDSEDLEELKRLRLINNLITVKELKDPDSLFKSKEEIESEYEDSDDDEYEDEDEDGEEDEDEISPEDYESKIKDYLSMEFDSLRELDEAKKEIRELTKQVDSKTAKKCKDLVSKLMLRKDIKSGSKTDKSDDEDVVEIDDIESEINDAIEKDYDSFEDVKKQKTAINSMIEKFKRQNQNADVELSGIEHVMNKWNKKIAEQASTLGGE